MALHNEMAGRLWYVTVIAQFFLAMTRNVSLQSANVRRFSVSYAGLAQRRVATLQRRQRDAESSRENGRDFFFIGLTTNYKVAKGCVVANT